jgi:hypothetical protein
MTVWKDKENMFCFVTSGAHRRAMKDFGSLGSGKKYGFSWSRVPDWDYAYQLWLRYSKAP